MNRDQINQQLNDLRQHLFNEGFLNDQFTDLEFIEDYKPTFLEDFIGKYFSSSATFMDELKKKLDTNPLDIVNVRRLISKLKGGSASIGAASVMAAVDEMMNLFRANRWTELNAALERIRVAHAALKSHLEQYAELSKQLRLIDPPEESSDNQEDGESIDSNDVDDAVIDKDTNV